jgi:hypothetical protein
LRNDDSGSGHLTKEEIKAMALLAKVDIVVGGTARNITKIVQKHIDGVDGDHILVAGDPSRTDVAWMLNDVINTGNHAISGGCEDNTTTACRVYLDAKKIGPMARRFPQAVFTIGSDAATWNSNKEFDHYVAAAAAGVAETGRNVESGVRLFSKLGEHRYFGGDCHYKRNDVVVDAFVDNIGNDIKYGCMSQSGARVFKKESCKDEVGIMSSGAADSNSKRVTTHDAYGLGDSCVTGVSPESWSSFTSWRSPCSECPVQNLEPMPRWQRRPRSTNLNSMGSYAT